MNDQLRPVDGRQNAVCGEVDLLTEVAEIVRKAKAEYEGGFAVAGRLEVIQAQRLLDRVFHGEVV